jgi:FkbM family methyltransferase
MIGLKKTSPIPLERLGSSYGGWYIPKEFVNLSKFKKYLISAGIGHDVSFDIEMQKRDFYVIALDPLVDCCNFALNSDLDQTQINIINAGLWVNSGNTLFYSPKIVTHDSWSITNSQSTSETISKLFPTVKLSQILTEIDCDKNQRIVMLKMDIEGAERYLFTEIELNYQNLDFIGIELDYIHLLPFTKIIKRMMLILETRRNIANLHAKGFMFIQNDDYNFFWLSENLLTKINMKT